MQTHFIKKLFILIILLFTPSIYSQTEESKFSEEFRKILDEKIKKSIYFTEEYIQLAVKLQSLTGYEKLYSDVKTILKNKNISDDDLDLYYKNNNLYHVKIYSYILSIDDDKCIYINEKNIITPSLRYVCTIELGYGIASMANINGNPLNIAYSYSLVLDEKIIVTVNWWDTDKRQAGKFIFVNTDDSLNFLYDFVEFSME